MKFLDTVIQHDDITWIINRFPKLKYIINIFYTNEFIIFVTDVLYYFDNNYSFIEEYKLQHYDLNIENEKKYIWDLSKKKIHHIQYPICYFDECLYYINNAGDIYEFDINTKEYKLITNISHIENRQYKYFNIIKTKNYIYFSNNSNVFYYNGTDWKILANSSTKILSVHNSDFIYVCYYEIQVYHPEFGKLEINKFNLPDNIMLDYNNTFVHFNCHRFHDNQIIDSSKQWYTYIEITRSNKKTSNYFDFGYECIPFYTPFGFIIINDYDKIIEIKY